MQLRLPPSSDSAHAARIAVSDVLLRWGRGDLIDSVALVTTELVANAIMHARTELSLSIEPADAGVKVAVTDGSQALPRWTPSSPTATSGRGLLLVERLSRSWGVEPLPGGGKVVWAQVDDLAVQPDASSLDDLLELWSDEPCPAHPVVETGIAVELDIDVQDMLDSRRHTDDLVRELQLMLLDRASSVPTSEVTNSVVGLAQRLDHAHEEFNDARRQIYRQTLSAAKHRCGRTTLHLQLHRSDAAAARRWLEALDDADLLASGGRLLMPPFPPEMTAFRRTYIAAITRQIDAAP